MPSHTPTRNIPPQPKDPKLMVWLGPHFFSRSLIPLGWEVIRQGHDLNTVLTWQDILSLTGGRIPHAVLVADASTPPLVCGMESFPCLTVFYAVDTHIHSWYPLYAQGFDICLVSLKDHLPLFYDKRLSPEMIWWFPPYAANNARPAAKPELTASDETKVKWDLLFAGTVDAQITPERFIFLQAVKERFAGLHTAKGSFAALFPKAAIILNECSKGDLNFRVFEALGLGSCLITPMVGHGMSELFTDGSELFVYPPGDVDAVVNLTHALLKDENLRRQTAANGLACIDAQHRASHRAKKLADTLNTLFDNGKAASIVHGRLANSINIHDTYLKLLYLLHAESVSSPALREAYLRACKHKAYSPNDYADNVK